MKKVILGIFVAVMVFSLSGVAGAWKLIPTADQAKEKAKADKSLAIEKGEKGDFILSPPGLKKVVLIHYKKGFGGFCNNNGVCEKDLGENPSCADCSNVKDKPEDPTSTCSAFLGAKWTNLPIDYVIDPDNSYGLTEEFVANAMVLGAEEWDSYTNADLFGGYTIDYNSSWDGSAPDGRNELLFGDYQQDGVIAVTVIWGYFKGKPSNRGIVEFDILFDNDFTWGDSLNGSSTVMDLQNIATHEFGHGVGLADLYDTVCVEETMYGYSNYGDIEKRTLNAGDIEGIQQLYGGI